MNWKELSEKCPNAVDEYINNKGKVKTHCKNLEFIRETNDAYYFRDLDWDIRVVRKHEIPAIPYYFDGLGVHILDWDCNPILQKWGYTILDCKSRCLGRSDNFPDRLSATVASVEEAFRIREKQLTGMATQRPVSHDDVIWDEINEANEKI